MDPSLEDYLSKDHYAKDTKLPPIELVLLRMLGFLIVGFGSILVCIYKEKIYSFFCTCCKKIPPPYEPPPTYEEALELARIANHQPPNQCAIQIE